MSRSWVAFREGLIRSLRYWQILAVFYITSLLSALPFAFLPALNLSGSAFRTSIRQAAQGINAWMLIEALIARAYRVSLGLGSSSRPELTSALESMLLFGLLAVIAAPLLAWITTAFFCGGVFLTYMEAPEPFQIRRFLWGCWRWFGAFLLLGLVQAVLGILFFIPVGGAALLAVSYRFWLAWLLVPLVLLFAALWLALFEFAQLNAVSGGGGRIWHAMLDALRFFFRQPLVFGGLYALDFLLLALIHIVFRMGILPNLPLTWWPVVLPAQQIFIFLRLWNKGSRLAGGTALLLGKSI